MGVFQRHKVLAQKSAIRSQREKETPIHLGTVPPPLCSLFIHKISGIGRKSLSFFLLRTVLATPRLPFFFSSRAKKTWPKGKRRKKTYWVYTPTGRMVRGSLYLLLWCPAVSLDVAPSAHLSLNTSALAFLNLVNDWLGLWFRELSEESSTHSHSGYPADINTTQIKSHGQMFLSWRADRQRDPALT